MDLMTRIFGHIFGGEEYNRKRTIELLNKSELYLRERDTNNAIKCLEHARRHYCEISNNPNISDKIARLDIEICEYNHFH